jgi:hypothetical protein
MSINNKVKTIKDAVRSLATGRAIAHVHCIYENIGDIACKEAVFSMLSNLPLVNYANDSKINLIDKLIGKQLLKSACLGGGTLIFAPLNTDWYRSIDILRKKGVKLKFTVGTGVRDPKFFSDIDNNVINAWREILNACDIISVRGEKSKEILDRCGIQSAEVIGDPVLWFFRDKIKQKSKDKKIGINISGQSYLYGDTQKKVFHTMSELINNLTDKGWSVTLYPTCREDVLLAEKIKIEFPDKIKKVYKNIFDTQKYIDAISNEDIFVGVKLHSVVLAHCSSTPSIMIGYQPKAYDYMESMGLNDYLIRSDKVEAKGLESKVDGLYVGVENEQNNINVKANSAKKYLINLKAKIEAQYG